MKLPFVVAGLFALSAFVCAAENAPLKFPAEQSAWAEIVGRFGAAVVAKPGPKTTELAVQAQGKGSASVMVDNASGHVVAFVANGAGFSDEDFRLFAAFPELTNLTLWHNSGFTGVGLAKLGGLAKLENVTLAGGSLDDTGMAALARLPALKQFRAWHDKFTDAGVAALRQHPTLESITLGPNWQPLITDRSVAILATCPKLKKLSIFETWLTWKDGLQALGERKETLTDLDLGDAIVSAADLQKAKDALPKTKIITKDRATIAASLQKPQVRAVIERWIPKDVISSALGAP